MEPDNTQVDFAERKKEAKKVNCRDYGRGLSSSPELPHPVTPGVSFKLKTNCPLDDGYYLLVAFSKTIWDSVIIFFTLTS